MQLYTTSVQIVSLRTSLPAIRRSLLLLLMATAPAQTVPVFSRSGVSLAEVRALQGAFHHAMRWLLPDDGSTRLAVSLVDGAITTPAAPPSASAV